MLLSIVTSLFNYTNALIVQASSSSATCSNATCTEVVTLEGYPSSHEMSFGIGDLTGDGESEFVVKGFDGGNIDPVYYARPDTFGPIKNKSPIKIYGYTRQGSKMWEHTLGKGIESGIWYSPTVVYDLDKDGRAEVYVKNATDTKNQWPSKITSDDEWIEKLDGKTGKVLTTSKINGPSNDYPLADTSNYGGIYSRNQLIVAYLDGYDKKPYIISIRGTYSKIYVNAYDSNLTLKWKWQSSSSYNNTGTNGPMIAADIDNDGRDEILLGTSAIDENGKSLWANSGNTDMNYVGDLIPSRSGLEQFVGNESGRNSGFYDPMTGDVISRVAYKLESQGICGDFTSKYDGYECAAREDVSGGGFKVVNAKGQSIQNEWGFDQSSI